MQRQFIFAACLVLLSSPALLADFQYEQTTRITGGIAASMARFAGGRATGPTTSTVAVKGNRMVHISSQSSQITDLDKETITHVDFDKKTYSVMTFEQMKQMMQEASQRMQGRGGADQTEMSFTASVKQTGQKKAVSGMNAQEYILTMAMNATDKQSGQGGAMNITNDMWMAPEILGYQEVRDFEKRMAAKMGEMFAGSNPMAAMRPGMGKGLADMAKEMSKLKGVPVSQVMRMGSTADGKPLPAASEAPELSQQSQPKMGDAAASAAAGAALGRLGGLGGFGKKKRQDQQPSGNAAGDGLFMETTTELSSFSSAPVDSSKFEVPAGFKQVESAMERHRR